MSQGLAISQDGDGVITVDIARPPDNAFTIEMCRELAQLLGSPPQGARLLRLRGEQGVFCRGREPSGQGADAARATVEALTEATRLVAMTDLVTVAEVDGEAAGFGVGLVGQCDLAVASTRSRFWFPEVSNGLAPALVLSWLPRLIGRRQAFWLTATATPLSASEALRVGLLNSVCESAELGARVDQTISTLLGFPSELHAEIKRDLRDFGEGDQAVAYRMAQDRLLLASVVNERSPH